MRWLLSRITKPRGSQLGSHRGGQLARSPDGDEHAIIAAFGDPHFNLAQSWADAGRYHQPFYGIAETAWNEPAHRWPGSYALHLRSWCLRGSARRSQDRTAQPPGSVRPKKL